MKDAEMSVQAFPSPTSILANTSQSEGQNPGLYSILRMAADLTRSLGVVLSRESLGSHQPLMSVHLSPTLLKTVAVHLASWRLSRDAPAIHLLQIRGPAQLFALSLPLPTPPSHAPMSMVLVTADIPTDNKCSIDTLKGISACICALMFSNPADPYERLQLDQTNSDPRILPACCVCSEICDESGSWLPLASYVQRRYARMFSHTYCPICVAKTFPELSRTLHH